MYYYYKCLILVTSFLVQGYQQITVEPSNKTNWKQHFKQGYQSRQNYYYQQQGTPNYQRYPVNYPFSYRPQYLPLNQQINNNNQQSISDILHSVATNDDLHCVPRLLCEITSGMITGKQQSSFLPVNIDMGSIFSLLSSINVANGESSSPVLLFGKAILLGYSSKDYLNSCVNAYPRCPRDPDRLVQYLNNHNGGFFRFFNGINQPSFDYNFPKIQKRILNKPIDYYANIENNNNNNNIIKFPFEIVSDYYKSPKTLLRFPVHFEENNNDIINDDNRFYYRKSKRIRFNNIDNNNNNNNNNDLDFQKPLPNHHAIPMLFPDRTGTGEFRLDYDEFNRRHNKNFVNF